MSILAALRKILLILAKSLQNHGLNFSWSALFYMKSRLSLKYFVKDCHWNLFFTINSPQTPANLFFFDNIGNSKAFHTVLI